MKNKQIIAIDGPAASGKSTTARKIAAMLGYTYIDTGAMYRAAALAALQADLPLQDTDSLTELLDNVLISFDTSSGKQTVLLNGIDVETRIREADITRLSSEIAIIPQVRKKLVELQQKMGAEGGVVMDGRDIGTVVFPDADIKFFLTAGTRVRALRRWKEQPQGSITLEQVEKDLIWRDKNDSSRPVGPLLQAEDAILVDTSEMTVQQQIDHIYGIINKKAQLGE